MVMQLWYASGYQKNFCVLYHWGDELHNTHFRTKNDKNIILLLNSCIHIILCLLLDNVYVFDIFHFCLKSNDFILNFLLHVLTERERTNNHFSAQSMLHMHIHIYAFNIRLQLKFTPLNRHFANFEMWNKYGFDLVIWDVL